MKKIKKLLIVIIIAGALIALLSLIPKKFIRDLILDWTEEPVKKEKVVKPFEPDRLVIDSINLDAKVVQIGTEKGTIQAPKSSKEAGWWKEGAKPGELGSAVITGHVDNKSGPAVFYNLKMLKKNNVVKVFHKKDYIIYKVDKVISYPRTNVPMADITCLSDKKRLNLITCTGKFDQKLKTYDHRLVVYCIK